MKVNGSCHCGQVTFEAEVDPAVTRICHCTDCQIMTGAAYRVNVAAPAATFRLTRGEPKIYVRVADSGNPRAHAFCGNCGTQIYSAAPRDPTVYALRVGTLAQRRELVPRSQIWCRSALPWVSDLSHIERIELQTR